MGNNMHNIEKRQKGYSVRVRRDFERMYLGTFYTLEEAIKVRDDFLEKYKNCYVNNTCVVNITERRYGKLTVVKYAGVSKNGKIHKWLCECDCGNSLQIRSGHLKSGNSKSCGCLKLIRDPNNKLPKGEASFNRVFRMYELNAKKKNLSFELAKHEFKKLTSSNCYYCNASPKNYYKRDDNGFFVYNGIDRKDNNKGYTKENSLPCCTVCNRAKSDMSFDNFTIYIQSLLEFYAK